MEDFFKFSSERVVHPKGVPHPVSCYGVSYEMSLNRESILGECFKLVINDTNLTEKDLERLKAFLSKYADGPETDRKNENPADPSVEPSS